MNYKDMVRKARRKTLRLTLKQQREILNIYKDTVKELSKKASIAGDKTLKKRWLEDYSKHLDKTTEELENRLYKSIEGAMEQAGKHAVDADLEFFKEAIKKAGIDLGPHFTEMFSEAPNEVLAGIIKGDFYKDGKGLSDRIWNYTNDFEKDIDYIIKRAIAEKKSARELAKDLETFVKPESRRPWAWGTVYPNLRTKQVDYNAQRLARTSITHAHRESQHESARRNPFVEAIHWELSDAHYERQVSRWGEDECDEYAEQDNYGLGVGNFPKDEVPLSHPQCLCVTYGVITKTLDEVADELNAWVDGEENPVLDEWYEKAVERVTKGGKYDIINTEGINKQVINYHKKAAANEPSITKEIVRIIKANNGEMEGLDFRLKTFDSFKRKAIEKIIEAGDVKEGLEAIYDIVRYTSISSTEDLTDHYFSVMEEMKAREYRLVRVKNTWDSKTNPYRGINTVIENNKGQKFELQFHTPESFDMKQNKQHDLYEEFRLSTTSEERKEWLLDEMFKMSSTLKKPTGVENIKSLDLRRN